MKRSSCLVGKKIRPFCYESTCFLGEECLNIKKGREVRQGYAFTEMHMFLRRLRLFSTYMLVTNLSNVKFEMEDKISKNDVDSIAARAIFNSFCY